MDESPGLRIAKFDASRLKHETMLLGKFEYLIDWAINEPACAAGYMEWPKETEGRYPYPHNEVHFVMSGAAKYTYTYQPAHMLEETQTVEAGDICLIRYGTMLGISPIKHPFRTLYVVMPMPEIPYG